MKNQALKSLHATWLLLALVFGGTAAAADMQSLSELFPVDDDDHLAVVLKYTGPRDLGAGKEVMGVFIPHFVAFSNTRNNPNFQETVDGSLRLREGAKPKMLVVLPPEDVYFSSNYAYEQDFPDWAASMASPKVNERMNLILLTEMYQLEEIAGQAVQAKDYEYLSEGKDFSRLYHDNLNPNTDTITGETEPSRTLFRQCGGSGFQDLIQGYDLVIAPFVCIADLRRLFEEGTLGAEPDYPVEWHISREKLYERAVAELQQEENKYRQALEQAPETLSRLTLPRFRLAENEWREDGVENTGTICSVAGVDELDLDVVNISTSRNQGGHLFPVKVFEDLDALFIDVQQRASSCRHIVLPVRQKETLKGALERKNIAYELPHHVYEFGNAFAILKEFFGPLEIQSRDEYRFYKALDYDRQVIETFKSEGINTFAKHAEFKQRYEGDFSSTDLGTVEGTLHAIAVKQKAEEQGQTVAAYLQAEREAEAARQERQRAAAVERAKRQREAEKEKAKEYPYYAEVSCGVMGTTVDVRACFTDTTLTVSMNNITREKQGFELGDVGTMRGNVLVIDLTEHFYIKAQNSHETLGITIDIRDRLTRRTVASDQAGDLYKVALIRR